jgi:DNA-binding MarR family transcriptional regulator
MFKIRLTMEKLSQKEIEILRFIRSQRHKTTVEEIARGLNFSPKDVEVFVEGMLARDFLKVVPGPRRSEDGYYTNPEAREKIYELLG